MVKVGCCSSGKSPNITAVVPAPDYRLTCRNSHLVTVEENSQQCLTKWRCDLCGQSCIDRRKCSEGCDFDICEACFQKHWVNLVQQVVDAKDFQEAIEMLKAVHPPERKLIDDWRSQADLWLARAVEDMTRDVKSMKDVLLCAKDFGLQPPSACSVLLSRAANMAAESCDEASCREAVVLAAQFHVKPSPESLTGGKLRAARQLCRFISRVECNPSGSLAAWQQAATAALQESASEDLRLAAQAGVSVVREKLAELRGCEKADTPIALEDASFKCAWEAVLDVVEGNLNGSLDILSAVPSQVRSKSSKFPRVAGAAIQEAIAVLSVESLFPSVVEEILEAGRALGVPAPSACCSYLADKMCTAAMTDDTTNCALAIHLVTTYNIEPPPELPDITLDAVILVWTLSKASGNDTWKNKAKGVISAMANEEIKSSTQEGFEAARSKILRLQEILLDLHHLVDLDTWFEVLGLLRSSSDDTFSLLMCVPPPERPQLGDVFRAAADFAVIWCDQLDESLVRCRSLGVSVPEHTKDMLVDALCEKVRQKDKNAIALLLRYVSEFEIDVDAARFSGDDVELEAVGILLESSADLYLKSWINDVIETFRERAAGELDSADVTNIVAIVKIVGSSPVSLASLPVAAPLAPRLLEVALIHQEAEHLAAHLATIALELESDSDRLLASVPEEHQEAARSLLGIYNSAWYCAPNGDSETADDKWVEFPSEFSRKAEKGFHSYNRNGGGEGGKRRVDVEVDQQVAKFPAGSKFALDFSFMTCMVTEPEKRGRVVPIRRYQDGILTDPAKGTMHPWYIKQVQDKDAKDGDWLSNDYFFSAFTDALRSAGVRVENPPEEMFDFRFNEDFRGKKDDGRHSMKRGGQEYRLPFGWKRFAVNVKGEYDEGDNKWLGSGDGSWAIAYHGTAEKNLPNILGSGFRVGPRQKFAGECGAGVYCTPYVDVGAAYAPAANVRGHKVQIVLQLRVKPSAIKPVTTGTDFEKKYWVINSPKDLRAYGVLVREAS